MHIKFNLPKAIQAAGVLLRVEGKKMSRLRLLKFMYLAERQSLEATGRPFLGGHVVVMKHGPLHSEVYDLIKGTYRGEAAWSQFIGSNGPREIRLDAEPDVDELSPFEVKMLAKIAADRFDREDYDVAEETHQFPEVAGRRPEGDTRVPISFEEIVRAACPAEFQDEMLEEMRERAAFDANRARIRS